MVIIIRERFESWLRRTGYAIRLQNFDPCPSLRVWILIRNFFLVTSKLKDSRL